MALFYGLLLVFLSVVPAQAEPFPVYDCIKPNVTFWENVYAKYSLSQAIIHDKENLAIVYGVVDLLPSGRRGAGKVNAKRIKTAKRKYKRILQKFARGKKPSTAEGRRIRGLFPSSVGRAGFSDAIANIRSQLGQKDRFRQGIIRSGAYLQRIKRIFRSRGLPRDLAYLPHVESSYNIKAYSKFGAAGLWQFTRSTGKLFMHVNYTLDERRDPIKSSLSAARLLQQNYRKLKTWPLAITAYNHGANGVMRAKKAKGSYERIFQEHNGRAFRFASRNFYSEFLAARKIAKNYKRYFGDLPLAAPEANREIELAGYVPVSSLADHFGISVLEIKRYNPALRPPVFLGRKYIPKGYTLHLPNHSRLASLARDIPADIYRSRQKRSRFYRVQRGDTVGRIARNLRVKVSDLVLANQLGRRATIYAGQNIRIPGVGEEVQFLAKSYKRQVAGSMRLAKVENTRSPVVEVEEVAEVAAVIDKPVAKEQRQHNMEFAMAISHDFSFFPDEDSAWKLPRVSQLVKMENNEDEHFQVADNVIIPAINPEVIVGNLQVEKVVMLNGKKQGLIRVEAEETLGHYATWLEVAAAKIRAFNGMRYGRVIRINQAIKIPLDKVGKEIFEERRYEYHKEIEEDFFAAYEIDEVKKYSVRRGDNIWTLCNNEFELPLWLIRKYNADVNLNSLKARQQLLVPVVTKKDNNFARTRDLGHGDDFSNFVVMSES